MVRCFALSIAAAALGLSATLAAQQAAPTLGPAAGRIPIEAFAAPPALSDPVLSPDGTRIAARLKLRDKDWIGVWDLRASTETPPQLFEQGDFDVRWLRWAGPNRLLMGIQVKRLFEGQEITTTRSIVLDTNTWRAIALETGHGVIGDDVIFVDPAGAYALITTQDTINEYPNVRRLDLATGDGSLAQRGIFGIWDWFADSNGVVRAGIDYRNGRIKIYYRSGAGQDLRRIDSRRYPQDGSVIDMIRFTSDTNRGIVVTNAVTGRFAVYRYDFATDTRGEAIFEHAQVDVSSVIMGENDEVDGIRYEDDRRRIHWLDPERQRMQASIDRALPNKINLMIDRSEDGNRILIWSSAADDPGTYYLYDRAARRIDPFATPYEQLADRHLAPVRPISFRSRDGIEIPGYLTLPPDRAQRGLPLILMPHGGPFARDSWEFDPWAQFLASRGYAVLQVNFRGSTGYGRAYVERGYGQWGTGMIDDMEDGVDWLVREGTADAGRVCIVGASYGGYAAMWAPIRNPARYRCAVSFAGISDLGSMLRYDRGQFTAARYRREWQRQVRGEGDANLEAVSPLRQVARVRTPLLIAHGERDRNVPVSQSRNLVRALAHSGVPIESVFYPEGVHGFTRPQDSADFLRRVEAFLTRYNPAQLPAAVPATAAAPAH